MEGLEYFNDDLEQPERILYERYRSGGHVASKTNADPQRRKKQRPEPGNAGTHSTEIDQNGGDLMNQYDSAFTAASPVGCSASDI